MKQISIVRAEHAPLFERYHLGEGRFLKVGDVEGRYSQEDRETGAEYRVLGMGKKGNKISYSSDLRPGHFYSPTVFVWGEDDNGTQLPHEQIEQICIKFWGNKTSRVILPNGWNKGWTWDYACYYVPPEMQPPWDWIIGRFQKVFPSVSVLSSYDKRIELEISC